MLGNADLRITIGGIDLTKYLISAPLSPIYKPEWGEIPSLPNLEAVFYNFKNILTPFNVNSILFGTSLTSIDVKLYKLEGLVWQGQISDLSIDENSKQITLICESYLSKQINKSAKPYFEPANPATIARALCQLHSVPVDDFSFARAAAILDDIAVLCRVNPDAFDWIGTLGDILQLLSVAGVGRMFANLDGTVGFETFSTALLPPSSITLTDNDILQWPQNEVRISDSLNGYKVDYVYGTSEDLQPDPEADPRTSLYTIDFGPNAPVQVLDPIGAHYIGSTFVDISRRDYYIRDLYLNKSKAQVISMFSSVTIQSTLLSLNGNYPVEGIDRSDPRWTIVRIRVEGYVS